MEVTYEGVTKHGEVGKVLNFLDVPQADLSTTTHKVRRQPVSEVVENYAELAEHFSGSEYEGFFVEGD